MATDNRTSVLFVCLGNICRSPLAEGVFTHRAEERGVLDRFHIDSCGTGHWHVGNPPDARAIAVAQQHGVNLDSRARQVDPALDFERFQWLIAMDLANARDLRALGAPEDRVHLLRAFDIGLRNASQRDLEVPDPYYGGSDGFHNVYNMIQTAADGLLDHLLG